MNRQSKVRWVVPLIIVALICSGVGTALAQSEGNIIYGAFQKNNGMLRIIDDPDEARSSEELIYWNQQGPMGPAGPQGERGPAGPEGSQGEEGPAGPVVEQHIGTKIVPGLYEVHTRVLWDLGWLDENNKDVNGFFNYYALGGLLYPGGRNLIYGTDRTTFLSPLQGYGIPDVQPGAVRKVRLYINYGHQLDSGGTPTIRIGDVEFYFPQIGGYYGDMAANWSNYRTYEEYEHLGHTTISMYNLNGAVGLFWEGKPQGTIYKIEAHYYDEFPE